MRLVQLRKRVARTVRRETTRGVVGFVRDEESTGGTSSSSEFFCPAWWEEDTQNNKKEKEEEEKGKRREKSLKVVGLKRDVKVRENGAERVENETMEKKRRRRREEQHTRSRSY